MKAMNAFKESVADTGIGLLINVPINFLLLSAVEAYAIGTVVGTILMTAVFTIFAIARKTYIRLHFEKRYSKES